MSSIVNKVKDALHSDKDANTTHTTTHTTNTTNTADPRVNPTHTGNTTVPAGGIHASNENYAVGTGPQRTDGPATKTDGPHNSNLMNKADPRIDSDRDHSRNMGANPHGTATTGSAYNTRSTAGTGTAGTTGIGGVGVGGVGHAAGHNTTAYGTDGPATKTDGPHNSNLMNKADPRVDSDRDYSRNMGANPHGTATTGTTTTHNSHITNQADPRLDSGMPAHHNTGAGPGAVNASTVGATGANAGLVDSTHGTHGTHGTTAGSGGAFFSGGNSATHSNTTQTAPTGTFGQHNSRVANAADPRIDSDGSKLAGTTHTGATHAGTTHTGTTHAGNTHTGTPATHEAAGRTGAAVAGTQGTGPAPHSAGPHKSDLLNKLDPRVDSNLDGSKTVGGDKTFAQSNQINRDPTDATQVPPSVFQQHVGGPTVHHNDATHDRERRHSVSHQEQHRGL